MKNSLFINENGENLLSNVNDGTNSIFINNTEIDSSEWVGSGNYTITVNGHTITISKISDLTGNIMLVKNTDYSYILKKISYSLYPVGKDGKDGITPKLMINSDGHLIAIYEEGE